MATIVLRNVKGSALTSTEMDDNIININDELIVSGTIDVSNNLVLSLRGGGTISIPMGAIDADTLDGKHYTDIIADATALAIALG